MRGIWFLNSQKGHSPGVVAPIGDNLFSRWKDSLLARICVLKDATKQQDPPLLVNPPPDDQWVTMFQEKTVEPVAGPILFNQENKDEHTS